MARPRKWTDAQRADALAKYMEVGPTEASKATGIPKGTLASWAKAKGLRTEADYPTREATEAIADRRRLKREQIRETMLDRIQTILDRINEPHFEFVGQTGRKETLPVAPSGAVRDYASAVATLYKDFRTDIGEVATRTDATNTTTTTAESTTTVRFDDAIHDHERDLIKSAIEREQERRAAERAGAPAAQ